MLLIVLALLWLALLAPMIIRRIRDLGADKSIENFHAEHEVLSRQGYAVPAVHQLNQPEHVDQSSQQQRRPRLTIVHDDDTYRSLESRNSWDDWSESYNFDEPDVPRRPITTNRYAAAYSAVPREMRSSTLDQVPVRRRTMKGRRRMMFTRLVLSTVAVSSLAFVTGTSVLVDLAVVMWVGVVAYVALALYSISQGYLLESSLGLGFGRSRSIAMVESLYDNNDDDENNEGFRSEYYDPQSDGQWRRESPDRYAVG